MKGLDLKKVRDTVVSCFSPGDFDSFLRFRFDIDRQAKFGEGPFDDIVFNTLIKAEKEAWLADLIAAVAGERPLRRDVLAMYRQYAATLVSEAVRVDTDAALANWTDVYTQARVAELNRDKPLRRAAE